MHIYSLHVALLSVRTHYKINKLPGIFSWNFFVVCFTIFFFDEINIHLSFSVDYVCVQMSLREKSNLLKRSRFMELGPQNSVEFSDFYPRRLIKRK